MSMVEFGIENGYVMNCSDDETEIFIVKARCVPNQHIFNAIREEFADNGFDVTFDGFQLHASKRKRSQKDIEEKIHRIENIRKFHKFFDENDGECISKIICDFICECSAKTGVEPEVALGCFFATIQDDFFDFLDSFSVNGGANGKSDNQ